MSDYERVMRSVSDTKNKQRAVYLLYSTQKQRLDTFCYICDMLGREYSQNRKKGDLFKIKQKSIQEQLVKSIKFYFEILRLDES